MRAKGGTYVSAQFTLVPGPGAEPVRVNGLALHEFRDAREFGLAEIVGVEGLLTGSNA